jgi:hypothetical protein
LDREHQATTAQLTTLHETWTGVKGHVDVITTDLGTSKAEAAKNTSEIQATRGDITQMKLSLEQTDEGVRENIKII